MGVVEPRRAPSPGCAPCGVPGRAKWGDPGGLKVGMPKGGRMQEVTGLRAALLGMGGGNGVPHVPGNGVRSGLAHGTCLGLGHGVCSVLLVPHAPGKGW